MLSVSALTGQRVGKLFEMARDAWDGRRIRVPTALLNHMFVPGLEREMHRHNPSHDLEIQYITQASVDPPTFVVFNPGRKAMHFSTERFLENRLRDRFGFYATPIRIRQRLKKPLQRRSR